MISQYGAHEIMELHEVLTNTINGINQLEVYKQYANDPMLRSMIDKHVNFLAQEYNIMTQALNQKGVASSVASYNFPTSPEPLYGLRNPQPETPMVRGKKLNDQEVCSGLLGYYKSSAALKMTATLECADYNLRRMVLQGAANCSEMAYEVWKYMNHHGWYQIPTLAGQTADTMTHLYQPAFVQMGTPGINQLPYGF